MPKGWDWLQGFLTDTMALDNNSRTTKMEKGNHLFSKSGNRMDHICSFTLKQCSKENC